MYRTVVTICTNTFNIKESYVLPPQREFARFVWISEQTAIISLYSINWLVCTTEMGYVYCAVRTVEFLLLSVWKKPRILCVVYR